MRTVNWRGLPPWRPEGEDAALTDPSPTDPAVDEALAALTAEPRRHELEGLAGPLAAFRTSFSSVPTVAGGARRAAVLSGITGLVGAKAAAAVGGIALGLGATALVVSVSLSPAATSPRPTPGGASASTTPTVTPSGSPTPTPSSTKRGVGPDATGPAAHGLCTAWSNHAAKGRSPALHNPPMRNLAEAAGGVGRIAAYCATVPHPGKGRGADKTAKPDRTKADESTPKPKPKPKRTKAPKPDRPASTTAPSPTTSPSTTGTQED